MRKTLTLLIAFCFVVGLNAYAQSNKVVINADLANHKINKNIYGQFAEHLGRDIYDGIWVGEDSDIPNVDGYRKDVLEALKELNIPVIRWPGGCFADEYHWKDGIGPRDERPTRINELWGMVPEDNSFGTHEFMKFTELVGAEPYISGNVGTGTPQEMSQWVEYLTYGGHSELADLRRKNGRDKPWHVKYWGIGNESWGCGGNMTPEYYADQFKRYATFLHNYPGNHLFKIASGYSDGHYHWTEVLMQKARWMMDGISLHYYTIAGPSWGHKGSSTDFSEDLYFSALYKANKLDEYITGHSNIMDQYDPQKRVALIVDEWGIWTDRLPGSKPGFLYQQNSLRDALVASTSLDILNHHSDRVRMANIAQMVNVLQAMVLTKGDQMVKTPTYYVFDMYKVHQDAEYLPINVDAKKYTHNGKSLSSISASASKDSTGVTHITMTNLDPKNDQSVTIDIRGLNVGKVLGGRVLTAPKVNSINSFDHPNTIVPDDFNDASLSNNELTINIPAKSVIVLGLK